MYGVDVGRIVVVCIFDGCTDTVFAFSDDGVWKSGKKFFWEASGGIYFDADFYGIDADECGAFEFG